MDAVALILAFVVVTFLGVLVGMVTGLSPGLHVNNVAALVLSTQEAWASFLAPLVPEGSSDPRSIGLLLSCFLLATAASHSVFNFIPSVFLGAPSEDTALATLPGHRLLLVGQGARAVALAARGAILGAAFAVALLIPLRVLLSDPFDLAERFKPWTALFLLGLLGALLATEVRGRHPIRRFLRAAWVQGLAGLLGIATLRGIVPIDPNALLFPLFSGLFGLPTLLVGLRVRPGQIPVQRLEPLRGLSPGDARCALRGAAAGAAISWLPGLSGGAAATLASLRTRKSTGPSEFMVVLGAVSTSTAILSVAVLFMIHRARSGAAAAIRDLMTDVSPWPAPWLAPTSLLLLVLAGVVATSLAGPLSSRLARYIARRWSTSNPRRISIVSLAAILGLLWLVTGPYGIAIAGIATVVGLVPVALRIRRVHLMASLLVPVILTYLGPLS